MPAIDGWDRRRPWTVADCIEGISWQRNSLGLGVQIQIIGEDPRGRWYQIEYAGAKDGKGWVTSQCIDVQDNSTINVVASTTTGSLSGTITQPVNVRRRPGTDSEAAGILNPKDVVAVRGKDSTGSRLQIQFPPGSQTKGWVAAGYVQPAGTKNLPVIAQVAK